MMRIEVVNGVVMSVVSYGIDVLIVVIMIRVKVVKSFPESIVSNLLASHILIRMHRHVME